jgi:NADH dehydrogenase/NADH:ubiquinone oxidoreductase subunit G
VSDNVEFTIDGQKVTVMRGTTVLEAARQAEIFLPALCYFAHTTANGLCRLCVVEVDGIHGLQAACVIEARQDAVVHTRSPNIDRARRTILEMLASTVDLSESIELRDMLKEYKARPDRFLGSKKRQIPLIDDNPVYIRDYGKCVLCWRCVQVCAEDAQYNFAINFSGRGFHTSIATFLDKQMPETTCVFCGQCVGVCPTGALKSKREYLLEQGVAPEEISEVIRMQSKGQHSRRGPRLDIGG